ncbi:MAG: winged helix-turn-helix transcriptional regulator [Anaerolineaceae bacterium]|nr:winged helix-turn-helix transcriptional regulator [Anaerolineaceae bacterium]
MQNSTDEEIINILSKNIPMSVNQLATLLNLTKADIRYQIKKLHKSGKVVKIEPELNLRGRPASRYKISDSFYKHNLIFLIHALFHLLPPGKNTFIKLSEHLSEKMDIDTNSSAISKLNQLISFLNLQNYESRWETQFHGPVIFFSNCPYRQVIQDHSELCVMDKDLIEISLNKKVKTLQTIVNNGGFYCKFQIII